MDFRSPRRVLPEIQGGWNRKGLISEDGKKKKAFYILQTFYKNKANPKKNKPYLNRHVSNKIDIKT